MSYLESLPFSTGIETRQISAENPTGEKGGACRETPDPLNPDLFYSKFAVDLGKGWKVRPFIRLKALDVSTNSLLLATYKTIANLSCAYIGITRKTLLLNLR